MNHIEKILRCVFAIALIVTSGDIFFRYFEWPEPNLDAQRFLISMTAAGYIWPAVGGLFLVCGILLFFRRFTGLALVLLFPVTLFSILFVIFHSSSVRSAMPGVSFCLIQLLIAVLNRRAFSSLVTGR